MMDNDTITFAMIALVAVVGLVGTLDGSVTGAAIEVIQVREYRSFAERLCPNSEKPVPVIVQSANEPGTTGKSRVVTCVSADTAIPAYGRTFNPEYNRKQMRYAYGAENYHQL